MGVGHSMIYRADIDRIFMTDGSDGDLKVFNGTRVRTGEDREAPGRFGCDRLSPTNRTREVQTLRGTPPGLAASRTPG
jgi:hypothetical protein